MHEQTIICRSHGGLSATKTEEDNNYNYNNILIINNYKDNCGNNKMLKSDWFLTALIYCLIWLVQHQTVQFDLTSPV